MTTLAQVALEFCRECLGWESPHHANLLSYPSLPLIMSSSGSLRYADLNAVMDAVRKWRDQTQEALGEYVTVTLSCASGQYIGHAFIGTAPPTTTTSARACHALLAACVEASRKMKDQSGSPSLTR